MLILTECTAPRVNPILSYGVWIIVMCQCSSSTVTNVPLWWERVILEELGAGGRQAGRQAVHGNFPLKFDVNIKML